MFSWRETTPAPNGRSPIGSNLVVSLTKTAKGFAAKCWAGHRGAGASDQEFDWKKIPKTLRVAMDSAPLEGAGHLEDTVNLLAHSARKVLACAAGLTRTRPGRTIALQVLEIAELH